MAPKYLERSCYIYKDIWSNLNILKPEEVFISTNKIKVWFKCTVCQHDYNQSPDNKTKGNGCPYCTNKKLCGDLGCVFCLQKSCYKYKDIWSNCNLSRPEHVFTSSKIKVWFKCTVCHHDYNQSPGNKTKGNGCHYCANQKICGNLRCTFCLLKSCQVYSDIWSNRNNLKPEQVSISNGKKIWFSCPVCKNEYEQSPEHKNLSNNGCPRCINKTEKKGADFLIDFTIEFTFQFKQFSNKPYDFCFPEYKLILEVDGDQHFRQVSNWGCPIKTLENDIQKMKLAKEHGYSVIRIYQPDIWNDIIDWQQIILDNLYLREVPDIKCYSSVVGIYDNHY
jgi:very-short-patch-repair endonuclease